MPEAMKLSMFSDVARTVKPCRCQTEHDDWHSVVEIVYDHSGTSMSTVRMTKRERMAAEVWQGQHLIASNFACKSCIQELFGWRNLRGDNFNEK